MSYLKIELCSLLVCLHHCIFIAQEFQYLPYPEFPDYKFNWEQFYNQLESMTLIDMIDIQI